MRVFAVQFCAGVLWSCATAATATDLEEQSPPRKMLPAKDSQDNMKCEQGQYPPKNATGLRQYVVDLDAPPRARWVGLMVALADEIKASIDVVVRWVDRLPGGHYLTALIQKKFGKVDGTLPQPFADELAGAAQAANISLGDLVLYNIFYEVQSLCTSIVSQTPSGEILHGRNMDFGFPFGWDWKKDEWRLAEAMRRLLVDVQWYRGGQPLFRSVQLAGSVFVVTGVKPNAFSISVNTRYSRNAGLIGILEWLFGDRDQAWVGFLTRGALENLTDFGHARDLLAYTRLVGPVYYIIAGPQPGQGAVISRERDGPADIWRLGNTSEPRHPSEDLHLLRNSASVDREEAAANWYVLETNWDRWRKPPFFDNRRLPADTCMNRLGSSGASFGGLYNVLSTKPVLNKQTVYTALMKPSDGSMEAYVRTCPDPCYPF